MTIAPTPTPERKIRILEGSVHCLVLGGLSLTPIVGAGFALAAFRERRAVLRSAPGTWNPARRQLRWGTILACAGALLNLAMVLFCVLALANSANW